MRSKPQTYSSRKICLRKQCPWHITQCITKQPHCSILFGIKCENHAATIILLKELFGIDNKSISSAKTERIDKQYYTDFVVRNNDVTELISIAESFIGGVDLFVDKITEEEKKHYLKEFKKAYFA